MELPCPTRWSRLFAVTLLSLLVNACASGASSRSGDGLASADSTRRGVQDAGVPADQQPVSDSITKGDAALGRGDLDRALYYYVEALSRDPDQALTLIKVGTIHWQRGDLQRSLEAFRRALALEPANPMALEGEGLALLDMGERQSAKAALERAVALDGTRWRSLQGLGVIADMSGDHIAGIAFFRRAIEVRKDAPSLYNNLGYSLFLAGDYANSERAYLDALGLDPNFGRAARNLGMLYVRLGRYDMASTVLGRPSPGLLHSMTSVTC